MKLAYIISWGKSRKYSGAYAGINPSRYHWPGPLVLDLIFSDIILKFCVITIFFKSVQNQCNKTFSMDICHGNNLNLKIRIVTFLWSNITSPTHHSHIDISLISPYIWSWLWKSCMMKAKGKTNMPHNLNSEPISNWFYSCSFKNGLNNWIVSRCLLDSLFLRALHHTYRALYKSNCQLPMPNKQ